MFLKGPFRYVRYYYDAGLSIKFKIYADFGKYGYLLMPNLFLLGGKRT